MSRTCGTRGTNVICCGSCCWRIEQLDENLSHFGKKRDNRFIKILMYFLKNKTEIIEYSKVKN